MDKKDIKIERICGGKKAGGQHLNKTASCIRVTHLSTGIVVTVEGRSQHQNLRNALKELQRRLEAAQAAEQASARKSRREAAIRSHDVIRDYDFKTQRVYDRRSGKHASVKDILRKGRLDLLRPDNEKTP